MTNVSPLRPADSAEVTDALAYTLRYDGSRRVHHAGEIMAQAGFVLLREAPGVAPTTSNMPFSIG